MALSGLDIYKLLPKTNCRKCGFATCLAFAMALAKRAQSAENCPYLSAETKKILEESSLPPIKLVTVGEGESVFAAGNETVMFRHEEKFHHPTGIGFIIEDNAADEQIKQKIAKINGLEFERVGQQLKPDLIAIRHTADAQRFLQVVKLIADNTHLALILMSEDADALRPALAAVKQRKPLIWRATEEALDDFARLAKEFESPLVVMDADLDKLSQLTIALNKQGVNDLVLDTADKSSSEKLWDLTQIRRQALKKSNRALGYPVMVTILQNDPLQEAVMAATFIAKYASIVLLKNIEQWEALAILTLRQNIYTDPQKPLQIEPKLYSVGQTTDRSPVLVTTNFSLSYYTVLGEVEASKIPAYIMSVDTEGMSVLTAWAAEKFTPEKISESLNKFSVKDAVAHTRLVIPGYVAVMSGDLEEKSGWQITVGPKEAAGIPSFLKNL